MKRDKRKAYEAPALLKVGTFRNVTGLLGQGPPDLLIGKNLL